MKAQLADIKELLLDFTLTTLQSVFGEEQQAWWDENIPDAIKQRVLQRCHGDEEKLRNKEHYLDIQDCYEIIFLSYNDGPIVKCLIYTLKVVFLSS